MSQEQEYLSKDWKELRELDMLTSVLSGASAKVLKQKCTGWTQKQQEVEVIGMERGERGWEEMS